ncbi:MAG: DUF1127 domain-containing protein [Albidovulum sp.]
MSVFATNRPATGHITGLFSAMISAVAVWNDARVTRAALSRLSDRELDDIGLCRGDIDGMTSRA